MQILSSKSSLFVSPFVCGNAFIFFIKSLEFSIFWATPLIVLPQCFRYAKSAVSIISVPFGINFWIRDCRYSLVSSYSLRILPAWS